MTASCALPGLRFLAAGSLRPAAAASSRTSARMVPTRGYQTPGSRPTSCRSCQEHWPMSHSLPGNNSQRRAASQQAPAKSTSNEDDADTASPSEDRSAVALRIKELTDAGALRYPRYQAVSERLSVPQFRAEFDGVVADDPQPGQKNQQRRVELSGRVMSVQRLGARLVFLKLLDEGVQVQVLCNLRQLRDGDDGSGNAVLPAAFKEAARMLNRGDHVAVTGRAMRTATGELTLAADALPRVYAPALAPLPARLLDADTRALRRHVDLLVNPAAAATLRLRACVLREMRAFFEGQGFVEVQTPILADLAGGAVARPFLTVHHGDASGATSAGTRVLSLRIAPELWLKRLVVGGLDRVFEIGPSFRNEGIDATHNPEFTTCEFYAAYWTLPRLVAESERLVARLARAALQFRGAPAGAGLAVLGDEADSVRRCAEAETRPFRQLEFIPSLEAALGFTFPDLSAPDAYTRLRDELAARGHSPGLHAAVSDSDGTRLAKLLDRLASTHLEARSFAARDGPLFITHHPACMSPLAKSFVCARTGQVVAARAELFVDGRELANMYEEENDPAAQRRKMAEQAAETGGDGSIQVDENYVAALEAGLPPTGGWGCGVERLVMLFAGSRRIAESLSFGTLRHVVAMKR